MSQLSQEILQTVEALPAKDQQQILALVQLLWEKHQQIQTPLEVSHQSFFDSAQSAIGAGEGPADLSNNLDYMQGYGQ